MIRYIFYILFLSFFLNLSASAQVQVPDNLAGSFRHNGFNFENNFKNKVEELSDYIRLMNKQYNAGQYTKSLNTADKILKTEPENKLAQQMKKQIEDKEIKNSEAYKISIKMKVSELIKDADNFAQKDDTDTALQYLMEALHFDPNNKSAVTKFMNLIYAKLDKKIEQIQLKQIEKRAKNKSAAIQKALVKKLKEIQSSPQIIKNIDIDVRRGKRFMIMLNTTNDIQANWQYILSDTGAIDFLQKSYFPPIDSESIGKIIYQFEAAKIGHYKILFKTDVRYKQPTAIIYNINSIGTGTAAAKISAATAVKQGNPVKMPTKTLSTIAKPAVAKAKQPVLKKGAIDYLVTVFNLKLYDAAIKRAKELIANEGISVQDRQKANDILAQSYFFKGDTDAAVAAYKILRSENPDTAVYQYATLKLGDIYFRLGQLQNAMRYYIEAKVLPYDKETSEKAILDIGNIFESMSPPQWTDAIDEYKKLLSSKNPDMARAALVRVADIYDHKLQKYYNANEYYKKLLRQFPNIKDANAIHKRAVYLENTYL